MQVDKNTSANSNKHADTSLCPILLGVIKEGYDELRSYYPGQEGPPPLLCCLEDIIFRKLFVDKIDINYDYLQKPCKKKAGAPMTNLDTLMGMSVIAYGKQETIRGFFTELRTTPLAKFRIGVPPDKSAPCQSTFYTFQKRTWEYMKGLRDDAEKAQAEEEARERAESEAAGHAEPTVGEGAANPDAGDNDEESDKEIDLGDKNPFCIALAQFVTSLVELFRLEPKDVRMDSTLMDSNIAHHPRYVIIIQVLRLLNESYYFEDIKRGTDLWKRLCVLLRSNPKKICYESDKDAIHSKMALAGRIIREILTKQGDHAHPLLKRMFDDQFWVSNNGHVIVRAGSEIATDSIQSAYDTEAAYRVKGDITVRGYLVNLTEVFGGAISLVTDVAIRKANASDKVFTVKGIERTNEIFKKAYNRSEDDAMLVKSLYADGAYQNKKIRKYLKEHDIQYIFTGFNGQAGNFRFTFDQDGKPTLIRRIDTNEEFVPRLTRNGESYAIPNTGKNQDKVKHLYFNKKRMETALARTTFGSLSPEEKMKRNNVESSEAHLIAALDGRQCRYRGRHACERCSVCRGIWMNIRRICEYFTKACAELGTSVNSSLDNLAYMVA